MAEDNNSRKNRLITYLLNYAYDHDIGYVLVESEPSNPSFAIKNEREIGINMNWHNHSSEVPFTIAHEIGHIMNGKPNLKQYNCCLAYGGFDDEEKDADIYGLHLIYQYSCAQEDNFYDPAAFIRSYAIPERMIEETYKMFADEGEFFYVRRKTGS
ncbi:hypothetical protein E0712_05740 [Lactobacillus helveticus]|uniref:hypothetical protein n=1 Tax=Lactobacillus helveticus TaxID=1587 RepID=UPI001C6499E2|nr:hypothetical protein [Lactobacillus helveticus]MBW8013960.1 hypothetical protein [Lactobacillus helveticus]